MIVPNNLTITMTCHRRLSYTKQVLESLKNADKTNINILFCPSIDYYCDEVVDEIKKVDFVDKDVHINKPRRGCNGNTLFAINRGMDIGFSNFVLHIEDDTVLTRDALQYFIYMFNKYHDDEGVMGICGHNKTNTFDETYIHSYFERHWFCPWGCGFWGTKWNIDKWPPSPLAYASWDWLLNEGLFNHGKFKQIYPVISRVQNIGALNGVHVPSADWHAENHYSPYTSDDYKQEIDWFRNANLVELPKELK